jgi:Protein of unknown function (DUF3768)
LPQALLVANAAANRTRQCRESYRATHRRNCINVFIEDNDPHGEHDFGSFEIEGRKLFFKIDYYDKDMRFGSEDPSDPSKTARVLTLMLAEEY